MSADDDTGEAPDLLCFITPDRECGADCMAYTMPPPGKEYDEQQWANCKLLTSLHQGGKHLTIIASIMSNADADTRRRQQAPPANPVPPIPIPR